jgi:hypothetical protein
MRPRSRLSGRSDGDAAVVPGFDPGRVEGWDTGAEDEEGMFPKSGFRGLLLLLLLFINEDEDDHAEAREVAANPAARAKVLAAAEGGHARGSARR